MTNYDELVKRLHTAAIEIRNDGTASQVGPTEYECLEAASAITRLQADLEEAVEKNRKLHRRCQRAERVQSVVFDGLNSWCRMLSATIQRNPLDKRHRHLTLAILRDFRRRAATIGSQQEKSE